MQLLDILGERAVSIILAAKRMHYMPKPLRSNFTSVMILQNVLQQATISQTPPPLLYVR